MKISPLSWSIGKNTFLPPPGINLETNPALQLERAAVFKISSALAVLITSVAAISPWRQSYAINMNEITSAAQIDPAGGDAISSSNPNFSTALTKYCSEAFAAKTQAAMTATAGIEILDFETSHSFAAATHSLASSATAFSGANAIAPFNLADAITEINTTSGHSIAVQWRTFDDGANILSAPDDTNGVFLVKDSAITTMSSGEQGLVSGAVANASLPGGAYLSFSQNLSDFGVVLSINSGNATNVIALFDADGILLAKYKVAVNSGVTLFFGIHSPTGVIRSVWVGQSSAANGLVIDDLAFKPASAPATSFSYNFAGTAALSGWSATAGAMLTTNSTHLTITATNDDSKIYRTIALPSGVYDIEGTGSGKLLVQVQTSWTTYPIGFLNLISSSTSVWRTDRQRFTAPGGNVFLVVRSNGATGSSAIKSLKVTSAYVTPYTYDTNQMASLRPAPAVVRGFMSGGNVLRTNYLSDARSWGANVMRLQVDPAGYANSVGKSFWAAWPTYLELLVGTVQAAESSGLKVVVDLHKWPFTDSVGDERNWKRPELNETMCRVWRDIATALLPYDSAVWGFDLFNEPNDPSQHPLPPREWWPLAINLATTIRSVNPHVWLIYEPGPGYMFSGFSWLRPLPDNRVIYSAHFYDPLAFTHQGVNGTPTGVRYPSTATGWNAARLVDVIAPATAFQTTWKVPIYAGELSAVRWGPVPDTASYLRDVINLLETRGWSWCYHAFREWNGWDLEMDNSFWQSGMPLPAPVNYTTDRGAVIKAAFRKNNQALLGYITASSSYTSGAWSLERAVDGVSGSNSAHIGWTSNNTPGSNHTEWLQIDFRSVFTIGKVVLVPRTDGVNAGYGFPADFTIQRSMDGINWTTVITQTNYPNPGSSVQTFTFPGASAQYIRITGTKLRANPNDGSLYRMQFAEVEVY